MNANELQQFFPLVPLVILDKFAKYFSVNVQDSEANRIYAAEYNQKCNVTFSGSDSDGAYINFQAFSPPANYTKSADASTTIQVAAIYHEYYQESMFGDRLVETSEEQWVNMPVLIGLYFDYRLGVFGAPSVSADIIHRAPAQSLFSKSYVYRGIQKLVDVIYYNVFRRNASVNFNAAAFSGLSSLIIAMENGIVFSELDYTDAMQAMTYIKATEKYAAEMVNARDIAKQKAAYEINDVMRAAKDSFSRDMADLNQKKLAIALAVQNEEKSALRDMQNLLLNAQSIRL